MLTRALNHYIFQRHMSSPNCAPVPLCRLAIRRRNPNPNFSIERAFYV